MSDAGAGGGPRFPALDGVRGLAALAIVVHHASLYTGAHGDVTGGQVLRRLDVGVPVFFALSGFLLYRPFVAARQEGGRPVRIPDYVRARLLRLLPAYWVALGLVAAVPYLAGVTPTIDAVQSGDWWRYFGLLQVYTAASTPEGFPHAWTLCVELSFYLLLPFWAWAWSRRAAAGRDGVVEIVLILGLGIASWGLRTLTYVEPQVLGSWFPFGFTVGATFLWFSVGMAAAVRSVRRGPRRDGGPVIPPGPAWVLALVAFLLLSYAAGLPRSTEKPSGVGFLLLHGVAAVIAALIVVPFTTLGGARRSLLGRVLASRPLARLGEVSYGVYLWHPIVVLVLLDRGIGTEDRLWILAPATAVGSIVMGTLSYELVERPARRLRARPRAARDRRVPAR
jgi:peptidoglycan/LPS O-acetylase OafA/YrhL